MWKHVFFVVLLAVLGCSLKFETMNTYRIEQIRLNLDYAHHVIFFHQPTRTSLESSLEHWSSHTDVFFYINDCQSNKLPQCNNPPSTPIILLYNRMLIRFNGDPEIKEEIVGWLERRIVSSPKLIHSVAELDSLLNQTPNVFCYCPNLKQYEEQSEFFALAKSLPFINYCLLNNRDLVQELGLRDGNITFFLNSSSNRREFEQPNRYEAWQWFVKTNFVPSIERAHSLAGQRFTHVEKKIKTYLIACDLSYFCEDIWQAVQDLERELGRETLGYEFRLAIQDQHESFTFNLYFHLTFNLRKFPALIHIDLQGNGEQAGTLIRHIEYLDGHFTIQALKSFIDRTTKGQIQPFYLSAAEPKSNGFYGKGGEKFIQKVVASNVERVIASSPNHYVLLVTALNIGCEQCESFYKQYKKIAALFEEKDITFGVLNANENEVMIQAVTQMPEVLLYKKDDKTKPVRMDSVGSFDNVMLLFKNYLGDAYSDPNEL